MSFMNDQTVNDNSAFGSSQSAQAGFDDNTKTRDRAEAVLRNLKIIAEEKAEADLGETAVPGEVQYDSLIEADEPSKAEGGYLGELELHSDQDANLASNPAHETNEAVSRPADQSQIIEPPVNNFYDQENSQKAPLDNSYGAVLPPSQTPGRPFIGTHEVPGPPQAPSGGSPLLGE